MCPVIGGNLLESYLLSPLSLGILRWLKIVSCGGLNGNGPQRCIYVNTWVPVGGTVWEGIENMALSWKLYHWGQ